MSKHIDPVELRGDCERSIVDVIDAVAIHNRINRMEQIEAILKAWADEKLHESTLVVRVAGTNGTLRNDGGKVGE